MKVGLASATTLDSNYTINDTTVTVASTSGWPTDTGITFAMDVIDSQGVQVAGTYNEFVGTVSTATSITNVDYADGTGDRNYTAGATTRVYIPVSKTRENRIVTWGLTEHDQDGTHGAITATSITATSGTFTSLTINGSASAEGWSPLGATPNTVTANGNNSFDLVFNSNDLTDTLTNGMRIRATRTVAAPNTSFSLDGTNDYYVKTSPNKLTFTDDFVCSAWVYLTSYSASDMVIVSRYNGTSGFMLRLNASTGAILMAGYNGGASNNSYVASYQSIPLNKWVHITAQLDMSTFTASTTTSYIMIDGVDVPASVTRGGTNPTALVQAGNLEVGSANGTNFFPGYIDQVAVYSAKVTQATILASINRALTGSETSLASAYSNGSVNDLNTTTPNNLTATNGATTVANSPFGNRGVSTTLEYGIVMANSFSTNTTVTVQVPEGCQLPTTGGISSVDYSTQSVPYGFPRNRGRWSVQSKYKLSVNILNPTAFTQLTGRQIKSPIGSWIPSVKGTMYADKGTPPDQTAVWALSTASATTASHDNLLAYGFINLPSPVTNLYYGFPVVIVTDETIENTSATTFYLLQKNLYNGSGGDNATVAPTVISLVNAYI